MDNLLYQRVLSGDVMTDVGNSIALARIMKDDWLYVHEMKDWLHRKNGHWESDQERKRLQMCRQVVTELKATLEGLKEEYKLLAYESQKGNAEMGVMLEQSEKVIKSMLSWTKACSNISRMNAMLDLVRSEPGIAVSIKNFDSKGHYLRTKNGVLDLRDGSFSDATSKYLMLKSCAVEFVKDADCPNWLQLIEDVSQGDKEFASFLARLAGQSLMGTADKNQLFLMYGPGGNGKSTFIDTLHRIMGSYAKVTNPELITGKHNKAEYYLAELAGIRMLLMSESARGQQLAEAMIKRLVDSGSITARIPAGRPFEYQPVATPILATNHLPHVTSDAAAWRRLTLIPFTYKVPEKDLIAGYRDKLFEEEGLGILNWMIEGCLDYQWQGLNPPEVVIEAKAKFQREANRVALFIDECCEHAGDSHISLQELRALFEIWAKENGFRSMGRSTFSEELGILGYERKKSSGGLFHVKSVRLHTDLDHLRTLSERDRIHWKEMPQQVMEF